MFAQLMDFARIFAAAADFFGDKALVAMRSACKKLKTIAARELRKRCCRAILQVADSGGGFTDSEASQ